jgi:hypothetical protein
MAFANENCHDRARGGSRGEVFRLCRAPNSPAPTALFPLSGGISASYSPLMDGIVLALLIAAMAATVGALFLGLFSMARGGEFDKRNANRFMRLRVICQGVAILLFILFMMVWHRG